MGRKQPCKKTLYCPKTENRFLKLDMLCLCGFLIVFCGTCILTECLRRTMSYLSGQHDEAFLNSCALHTAFFKSTQVFIDKEKHTYILVCLFQTLITEGNEGPRGISLCFTLGYFSSVGVRSPLLGAPLLQWQMRGSRPCWGSAKRWGCYLLLSLCPCVRSGVYHPVTPAPICPSAKRREGSLASGWSPSLT